MDKWHCKFPKPTNFCEIIAQSGISDDIQYFNDICKPFESTMRIYSDILRRSKTSDEFSLTLEKIRDETKSELNLNDYDREDLDGSIDRLNNIYEDFDDANDSINEVCKTKKVYRIMSIDDHDEFINNLKESYKNGDVPDLGDYWSSYPYAAEETLLLHNKMLFEAEINPNLIYPDLTIETMLDLPSESEIVFDADKDFVLVKIDEKDIIIDGKKVKIPIQF